MDLNLDKEKEIPPDQSQYKLVYRKVKNFSRNHKLLDVGAANCILKSVLPGNIKYYSLDIEGNVDYHCNLDKEKIPLPDASFDIVVCLETLEHLMFPSKVLEEIKRVGKKNGIFLLSMPNDYNFLLRLYYLFGKKTKMHEPFMTVSKHLHIHNPRVKDIISIFSKHFEIKKVEYLWESRMSYKSGFARFLDKLINSLAQICPTLFTRVVFVYAKNKN
ncbi:MAG: methyltransferase domain-containing protein [Nanoarchaeota archaeon]|nr:class I SAM-dependent methyltransferase [Nanoarchaeota archaeon]MBU1445579.1 class I SAM-dependent methyltransferase [Nanoarchaeota archaeon]MBU2420407.1 class I SAM-dependent methyltransferase [Nanoarchaeota archaeon]MBU2475800.1 class I SAM-dependent methyltransferase [Nanoarchaeota archaeon]